MFLVVHDRGRGFWVLLVCVVVNTPELSPHCDDQPAEAADIHSTTGCRPFDIRRRDAVSRATHRHRHDRTFVPGDRVWINLSARRIKNRSGLPSIVERADRGKGTGGPGMTPCLDWPRVRVSHRGETTRRMSAVGFRLAFSGGCGRDRRATRLVARRLRQRWHSGVNLIGQKDTSI